MSNDITHRAFLADHPADYAYDIQVAELAKGRKAIAVRCLFKRGDVPTNYFYDNGEGNRIDISRGETVMPKGNYEEKYNLKIDNFPGMNRLKEQKKELTLQQYKDLNKKKK